MTGIERWRPIAGFTDLYEVSDQGNVRGRERVVGAANGKTKVIKAKPRQAYQAASGHLYVDLYHAAKRTKFSVHRLVIETFAGPAPDGTECCHRNGDPTDNRAENLYWGTRSDNLHDAVKHGAHGYSRRTHCKNGHEFTPENTFARPGGARGCLACNRKWKRDHKLRKRAVG